MGLREWFLVAKVLKKGADAATGKISKEQAEKEGTDLLLGFAGILPPVPLKNMIATEVNIQAKIAEKQQNPNSGDVTHLRTYLMSYYGHLMQGGDPAPSEEELLVIQNHPEYNRLVAGYPALQTAVAALEMERESCVFGYQMADGTIYPPDIAWLPDQWAEMREKAVDQTARCWRPNAQETVAPVAPPPTPQ